MKYSISQIKEIIEPVCKEWGIEKMLLFGSYAKGEATDESDIDLIVYDTNNNLSGSRFYALVGDLRDLFNPVPVEVLESCDKERISWLSVAVEKEGIVVYEC
ncbi:MAG: nucleotidyltransferase domain-containing protein [Oscillospiraceae bacterium]|nr:nucleotidyltransferase domain-containing protein [Oscillospiraceae bacterium]